MQMGCVETFVTFSGGKMDEIEVAKVMTPVSI